MTVELSHEELFLIEMALDEVLVKFTPDSKLYEKFHLVDQKIYSIRKASESSTSTDKCPFADRTNCSYFNQGACGLCTFNNLL